MIAEVSFYLLVTLAQRKGVELEAFGNFAECMTSLAEQQRDNDDLIGFNRCDEIKLYPVEGEPKEEEERSRDNGTTGQ